MAGLPTIAVAAGDPCGVGPEVTLKGLARLPRALRARWVIIGDHAVFSRTARQLRRLLPRWEVVSPRNLVALPDRPLVFLDSRHRGAFAPGRTSETAGRAALDYLQQAAAFWKTRRIQALVTAPVTKWAIARSEPSFVGQTEYLSAAMGARDIVMMFIADTLRVALLTRHLPLRRVPGALTREAFRRTLRVTSSALKRQFGIARPRLAVLGLNPHAGESGRCGREELTVMGPVLRTLRAEGFSCDGPFAADGFFSAPRPYDAVICAYHDQGLIPFKMAARDRGCQFTAGLPLIRTSPDHGSALDIAGKGVAHPGSMVYALELAVRLATSVKETE